MATKCTIVWPHEDMIDATLDCWEMDEDEASNCEVIKSGDSQDGICLIVRHIPTGRTSDEAGNGGRWNLDGTAY